MNKTMQVCRSDTMQHDETFLSLLSSQRELLHQLTMENKLRQQQSSQRGVGASTTVDTSSILVGKATNKKRSEIPSKTSYARNEKIDNLNYSLSNLSNHSNASISRADGKYGSMHRDLLDPPTHCSDHVVFSKRYSIGMGSGFDSFCYDRDLDLLVDDAPVPLVKIGSCGVGKMKNSTFSSVTPSKRSKSDRDPAADSEDCKVRRKKRRLSSLGFLSSTFFEDNLKPTPIASTSVATDPSGYESRRGSLEFLSSRRGSLDLFCNDLKHYTQEFEYDGMDCLLKDDYLDNTGNGVLLNEVSLKEDSLIAERDDPVMGLLNGEVDEDADVEEGVEVVIVDGDEDSEDDEEACDAHNHESSEEKQDQSPEIKPKVEADSAALVTTNSSTPEQYMEDNEAHLDCVSEDNFEESPAVKVVEEEQVIKEETAVSAEPLISEENTDVNEKQEGEVQYETSAPSLSDPDPVKFKILLEAFNEAMESSAKSQQDIHDWDRKMGLKRSHSKTMRLSSRSRKKLRAALKKEITFISQKLPVEE